MDTDRIAQMAQVESLALTWAATVQGIPTEDQLRAAVQTFRNAFGALLKDHDSDRIFDSLSRKLAVRMDLGTIIESDQYKPWLQERRNQIDWTLWTAYYQLLVNQGRPPLVLDTMAIATDRILDHLGDPAEANPWARRGLVIGDVQSGKTSNYIGLMNKAADAGYRIFIVLTGNTESLRRQTQERIDEGTLGRDSAAPVMGARQGVKSDRGNRIGVGLHLESISSLASTTTVLADFNAGAAKAQNLVPGQNLTIVFVTKKNKRVLDRIADWLRSHTDGEGQLDLPLLFLDDEADYASVNTNKQDEDPTAINQAIRTILSLSRRNSYVGFTATPFANIFINDEDDQDLFPKDFIYGLDAPSNYTGAPDLFGAWNDDSDTEEADEVRVIEDAEDCIPLTHKSVYLVEELPDSATEALRYFLIANAIRDLRGELRSPRSMLINVSRFNRVQQRVAELVAGELAAYRNALTLHAVPFAKGVPNDEISALQATFEQEFLELGVLWSDVLEHLMSAVAEVDIRVVNARRDRELEEQEKRDGRIKRTIAIGGDLLSRGLTLDGLMVSYYYRRTAASDTLLQMGRWFGYREGYRDLCRIWLSAETISNYAFTADSLQELRLELDRMRDQGLTPQQYGLAVRSHPGTLLITARNKMRSATPGKKSISLRGRAIEAATITSVPSDLARNVDAATELIRTLIRETGMPKPARRGTNNLLWSSAPKTIVADFLKQFVSPPSAALFSGDSLERFVRSVPASDLQAWDVVLMSGRGASSFNVGGVSVPRPTRKVRSTGNVFYVSEARRRVAGPGDVGITLTRERQAEIEHEYRTITDNAQKRMPDKFIIPKLERPALLLYPIEGQLVDEDQSRTTISATLVSFVLAIPGTPVDDDQDNVVYYLNAVAQRYWFEEFSGDEEDSDGDD